MVDLQVSRQLSRSLVGLLIYRLLFLWPLAVSVFG